MSRRKRYSFGSTRDPKPANILDNELRKQGTPHAKAALVTKLIVNCKCGIISSNHRS